MPSSPFAKQPPTTTAQQPLNQPVTPSIQNDANNLPVQQQKLSEEPQIVSQEPQQPFIQDVVAPQSMSAEQSTSVRNEDTDATGADDEHVVHLR